MFYLLRYWDIFFQVDNFIHADMHPGNILVRNKPHKRLFKSKPHVIFLDVGMTAELSGSDRVNLLEFFKAVAHRDGRTAAECTLKLSKQQNCPNPKAFVEVIYLVCNCFVGTWLYWFLISVEHYMKIHNFKKLICHVEVFDWLTLHMEHFILWQLSPEPPSLVMILCHFTHWVCSLFLAGDGRGVYFLGHSRRWPGPSCRVHGAIAWES